MILDFRSADTAPMSKSECELFTVACLGEVARIEKGLSPLLLNENEAEEMGFLAQILEQRLKVMSPETSVTVGVAATTVTLSKGNPGRMVMWAYTLHRMFIESGKIITMDELTNAFPMGFPTDEAFLKLWDGQKSDGNGSSSGFGGNLLDSAEAWAVE